MKQKPKYIERIFEAVIISLLLWVGNSASHLPAIEQKLDDFIISADSKISDHENRIRHIETIILSEGK